MSVQEAFEEFMAASPPARLVSAADIRWELSRRSRACAACLGQAPALCRRCEGSGEEPEAEEPL